MDNNNFVIYKTPLVSIITPVFNSQKYLKDSIESVLAQTYQNWELILVDDCSTDQSADIILKYTKVDSRIKYYKLQSNMGSGAARNMAMKCAAGNFMAFLDSDDVWLPRKLEVQTNSMIKNNTAFSFTSFGYISSSGQVLRSVREAGFDTIDYAQLVRGKTIGCLTVMLNIEMVGKKQMPNIRVKQDYVLWLNILKEGFTAHPINEMLALYRLTDGSATSKKYKLIAAHYRLLRESQGLSVLDSVYGVFNWGVGGFVRSSLLLFKK